jgi:hypothetical protein
MRITNLLKWLTTKNSCDVPEYSALRAVPTRGLPPALTEEESGDSFSMRRNTIEREILESNTRLRDDVPLFVEMIAPNKGGILTIPLPEEGGRWLPIFTTPVRAADYKQTLLTSEPGLQYLSSTTAQLVRMLCDLDELGIKSLTVDRCPRCSIFVRTGTSGLRSQDLLRIWAIHKATEVARSELYIAYAFKSARAGQLETARNVALETVGHVVIEDPRPHMLLGELGVALRERALVHEAQEFLRFLKQDIWARRLADIARSDRPKFEDLP